MQNRLELGQQCWVAGGCLWPVWVHEQPEETREWSEWSCALCSCRRAPTGQRKTSNRSFALVQVSLASPVRFN